MDQDEHDPWSEVAGRAGGGVEELCPSRQSQQEVAVAILGKGHTPRPPLRHGVEGDVDGANWEAGLDLRRKKVSGDLRQSEMPDQVSGLWVEERQLIAVVSEVTQGRAHGRTRGEPCIGDVVRAREVGVWRGEEEEVGPAGINDKTLGAVGFRGGEEPVDHQEVRAAVEASHARPHNAQGKLCPVFRRAHGDEGELLHTLKQGRRGEAQRERALTSPFPEQVLEGRGEAREKGDRASRGGEVHFAQVWGVLWLVIYHSVCVDCMVF